MFRTILYYTAAIGDVEKVKQLLAFADTPDVRGGQYKRTPLHEATQNNSTEAAKLLLEHGAEIKARNANNRTSLHDAAGNSSTEAAKLLLEHGAEIEERNVDNGTPRHDDAVNNSTETAKLLVERGAEIAFKILN